MIREYPSTNFNEYNLDWCIARIKDLTVEWVETKADWEKYKEDMDAAFKELQDFVTDYFAQFDMEAEVTTVLAEFARTGVLSALIEPFITDMDIPQQITDWLDTNITIQPGYVIDASLTVQDAAADAKVVGDKINDIQGSVRAGDTANNTGVAILPAIFTHGSWTGSGPTLSTTGQYRITTITKVIVNEDTVFTIKPGFRARRYWFDRATGLFDTFDGSWSTGSITLYSDKMYYVNIARSTDDTSEVADIQEFANAVYYEVGVKELKKNLIADKYAAVDDHALLPSTFQHGSYTAQAYVTPPEISNVKYRICTTDPVTVDFPTTFKIDAGFRVRRYWFDRTTGDWETFDGPWVFDSFTLNPDKIYLFNIARIADDEDVTEDADLEYFANRVYKDNTSALPKMKVLALGDSICRGGRNGGKGFIGDIGLPYINMGVGGATLSSIYSTYSDSIHQFPTADNIPNQLTTYAAASDADIQTAFGISKFTPDVIVANGGINDYLQNAVPGTLSAKPVTTDADAALLDRNTVYGALEYLFYQMIKNYPKAQRFYVIMHKVGKISGVYYPTRTGSGGYTQNGLGNMIKNAAAMYDVKIIDVYNEGIMNTLFSQYRASQQDWHDAAPDDYCDYDGVHPLAYGYEQAYVPLIRMALKYGTEK